MLAMARLGSGVICFQTAGDGPDGPSGPFRLSGVYASSQREIITVWNSRRPPYSA
jgi:hypothetical protein